MSMPNRDGEHPVRPERTGHAGDYEVLLEQFNARAQKPADCVKHLVSLGFRTGQARSAVYRYRERHGLLHHASRET
jgi:hypothetical protein